MNKIVISLILSLSTSLPVVAKTPQATTAAPPPAAASQPEAGKHHGIQLKHLREEIGLSKEQESKIKSLFKKNKEKIKGLKQAVKKEENNP
ncbi:MAG: hypothetical protein LUQ57_05840 [Methylococcaceae bacterium]|nr:hypothetical protein [Methylococcaceae bacterium]